MSAPALDPYATHYGLGFDRLVRGMTSLTDVWELIPDHDQGQLLDLLLPGLTGAQQRQCWDELADPLEQLVKLDAISALDTLREQGARGPLDPGSAYDRVRGQIEHDIADVIRSYRRTVTGEQAAILAVTA